MPYYVLGEVAFFLYELATVMFPALMVFALISHYRNSQRFTYSQRHERFESRKGLVPFLVLCLYITGVFSVTGAGTLFDIWRTGLEINPNQINLIPFLMDSYPAQYTLNAVMFIPLGFLLPYLWPQVAKIQWTVLYGLGFSLLIELSQLLNNRASDVDDLIMNTLGALIGFSLFALLRRTGKISPRKPDSPKALPALYLGVMFAGRFLLFNEMGLARLLYGF